MTTTKTPTNSRLVALIAAAILVFAACSSSTDATTAAPATTATPAATAAPATTATPAATAAPTTTAASTTEQPASAGSAAVSIVNFSFNDSATTVSVGDTVTFTNNEAGIAHTTTATEGLWNSGNLNSGDTFDITFTEAGTFNFFCTIHPSMTGTITVTE